MKKKYSIVIFIMIFLNITILASFRVSAQDSTPWYLSNPISPRVGDIVTFDASDFYAQWPGRNRNGTLIWYFGDNQSATGAMVNHTYTSAGTYVVGTLAAEESGDGVLTQKDLTVREQTPVTVNFELSDNFIQSGQEVTISGNLLFNESGVPNEWITLSSTTYPFTQWNEIATIKTDEQGQYSFDWKAFYGYYHVQALWEGNATYPQSDVSRIFIVEPFGDLINEYESNSTITGMNYNVTTRILKFQAEGPSGTTGYIKIYIREDWKFDPEKINVLFDGKPIEYEIAQSDDIWILEFNYNHSIHNVEVNFDMYSTFTPTPSPEPTPTPSPSPTPTSSPSPTPTPEPNHSEFPTTIVLGSIAIIAMAGIGGFTYFKKFKK